MGKEDKNGSSSERFGPFTKDKSDRATVEEVLDPRTKIILFKLMNSGFISELNGSISRGKEANVFYAQSAEGERAIKIYKTSILTFKKRRKYIEGEFRFRKMSYSSNPRKMIKMWAEKEMRNLVRMQQCGIICPRPLFLKNNVLVMEFIGENGNPAPLLKNAEISEDKARELYLECVLIMRRMFNECKLVHADLSEFNMLLFRGQLYVIDVSQSVEHDHPLAFEFLRMDCTNVNDFFRKKNVQTMTLKELFDFITDPNINQDNLEECLDKLQAIAANRSINELTEQEKMDDEVFRQCYIPQRLDQIMYFERDFYKEMDEKQDLYYQTTTGMRTDLSGPSQKPRILMPEKSTLNEDDEEDEDEEEDDEECSDESGSDSEESDDELEMVDEHGQICKINFRPRGETTEERRLRKKAFKAEKAEKRKSKIPKHIKKRNEKKGQRNTKVKGPK
jgi:RIO kinase 1